MKLAIDIGNTSISCGVFFNKKIIKRISLSSLDALHIFLTEINDLEISKIIISSVVPNLNKKYHKILSKKYSCPIIFIDYPMSNVQTIVPNPDTIGADRLCNICSATKLYKSPLIIIDFGTATTYDVINSKDIFVGGIIAPGIETSAKYLINDAALLSNTELKFPKNVIGTNTEENIQSGIMFGAVAQIEGIIKRIQAETNTHYSIILTGGFSELLSTNFSIKHIKDKDLTIKGIIYIDETNNKLTT